jgi:polyhydroxyalkanoate synthesis regulator phasin
MLQRPITPALAEHLQGQFQFFNNWTSTFVDSVRQINALNIEMAKEFIDDLTSTSQQLREASGTAEIASTGASRLVPATEKLKMHQRRLTNIVANTNLELTKKAESYLPEASRTATAVAEEIRRQAAEEADKLSQRGKETVEKIAQAVPVAEDGASRKAGKPNVQQPKQNQPQPRGT